MIYTKLTRSVFPVFALLFAGAVSAQELVAVSNPTEPATSVPKRESNPKPTPQASSPHKLGPLDLTINWRFRTEAWDWFEPPVAAQTHIRSNTRFCALVWAKNPSASNGSSKARKTQFSTFPLAPFSPDVRANSASAGLTSPQTATAKTMLTASSVRHISPSHYRRAPN